jgi:O-antigen/teichoic acid export membrane protein
MPHLLGHLLVAAAVTLAVGLLTGGAWAFVVGAVLSLSLWVMLFAGSWATRPGESRGTTSVGQYALAAALGVVLGYVMFRVGGNASFWAVGFIMAGAIVPAGAAASRESRTGSA